MNQEEGKQVALQKQGATVDALVKKVEVTTDLIK